MFFCFVFFLQNDIKCIWHNQDWSFHERKKQNRAAKLEQSEKERKAKKKNESRARMEGKKKAHVKKVAEDYIIFLSFYSKLTFFLAFRLCSTF